MKQAHHALIIGCGYLGQRVAQKLLAQGARVSGIVQSNASAAALSSIKVHPIACDMDDSVLSIDTPAEHLYYFLPPTKTGESDTRLRAFLQHLQPIPKKILLVSTTGVYGDCNGAWVDETQSPQPQNDRARRRLDTEHHLQLWCALTDTAYVILRVPGIYGPWRLPLARIEQRQPVVCANESPYTNRIHVDDLAQLCILAMAQDESEQIYNAGDGAPGTMWAYFQHIASLFHLPEPPAITLAQAQTQLSAGMLSYMRESRRIRVDKAVQRLGFQCQYPSLQEGLQQCYSEMNST